MQVHAAYHLMENCGEKECLHLGLARCGETGITWGLLFARLFFWAKELHVFLLHAPGLGACGCGLFPG